MTTADIFIIQLDLLNKGLSLQAMFSLTVLTIAIASVNIGSRSSLNVLDRLSFGRHRRPILLTSLINNLVPLIIVCPVFYFGPVPAFVKTVLFAPAIVTSGLILHIVALAFSVALAKHKIPDLLTASKLPDLILIPILGLIKHDWHWIDPIFGLLTVACFIPVFASDKSEELERPVEFDERIGRILLSPTLIAVSAGLLIQGVALPLLLESHAKQEGSISCALGTLIWRTVFSTIGYLLMREPRQPAIQQRADTNTDAPNTLVFALVIIRGFATLVTQFTFVAGAMYGNSLLFFPLVDSTPLFSSVASMAILHEAPSKIERRSIALLLALTLARAIVAVFHRHDAASASASATTFRILHIAGNLVS